jgi:hypothetical protein
LSLEYVTWVFLVTSVCWSKKAKVLWDFPTYERKKKKGFISKLLLQKIVSGVWFGLLGTAE